jgi:hypothetical protein
MTENLQLSEFEVVLRDIAKGKSHSHNTKAMRSKLLNLLAITQEDNPNLDIDYLMQLVIIKNMLEANQSSSKEHFLGFAMILLRFAVPLYHRKSWDKIFDAIKAGSASSKISELVADYRLVGYLSNDFSETDIRDALASCANVSPRTASRYKDLANEVILFELFDGDKNSFISQINNQISNPNPRRADREPAFDAIKKEIKVQIRNWIINRNASGPMAYDVSIMSRDAEPRQFAIHENPIKLSSINFASRCAGQSGLIISNPGGGMTTTLRAIAYGDGNNSAECLVIVVSALEIYHSNKGEIAFGTLAEIIARDLDGNVESTAILHELRDLNLDNKLIVIVDDLPKLDNTARDLIVSRFAGCRSIYFCVHPWDEISIINLLHHYGVCNQILSLRLANVTPLIASNIYKILAMHFRVEIDPVTVWQGLHATNFNNTITPLDIGAFLCNTKSHGEFNEVLVANRLLSEVLRRCRLEPFTLAKEFDMLDNTTQTLIVFGSILFRQMALLPSNTLVADQQQTVWIDTDEAVDVINSLPELIRFSGLIQFGQNFSGLRLTSKSIERLLCALALWYFGEPAFTFWNRFYVNYKVLDNIRMLAQSVPAILTQPTNQETPNG